LETVKAIYGYCTIYQIETLLLGNAFIKQPVILVK